MATNQKLSLIGPKNSKTNEETSIKFKLDFVLIFKTLNNSFNHLLLMLSGFRFRSVLIEILDAIKEDEI